MSIRPAEYKDTPELLRIGRDFYELNPVKEHVPLDETSLVETLQVLRLHHILLVLEIEGKVVGAAGAYIAPLYFNFNYLQGVEVFWWIDPEHRNSGNGIELKTALEEAVKQAGVKFWNMIALESSEPDKVGRLYKSTGYTPTEHTYMKVL